MLSKTCVKAALLLIPSGAAAHPVPPFHVCHPLSRCSRSAFVCMVVAVPLLCCVGRRWSKTHYRTCLQGQWATLTALLWASLAVPWGWLRSVPWDAFPAAERTARVAFIPASLTGSTSGGEAMARGFPGRALMPLGTGGRFIGSYKSLWMQVTEKKHSTTTTSWGSHSLGQVQPVWWGGEFLPRSRTSSRRPCRGCHRNCKGCRVGKWSPQALLEGRHWSVWEQTVPPLPAPRFPTASSSTCGCPTVNSKKCCWQRTASGQAKQGREEPRAEVPRGVFST